MEELLFGTAGIPRSVIPSSTTKGIERIAELGLGCMELEFVKGVYLSPKSALAVAQLAGDRHVTLTAHAPYYVNLNAHEPEKIEASRERILRTARIAALCGAVSIVFHAAFYLGDSPSNVHNQVKMQLQQITSQLRSENNRIWVRPEVTGKVSQYGTLEELLELSTEVSGVAPCIDFAHWHARTGAFNSYDEFMAVLKQIESKLGRQALDDMHIHVSGIAYGKHGEIKHLNMEESDFNYIDFIRALNDCKVKGLVICESPNLEDDAQLLQRTYKAVSNNQANSSGIDTTQ